MKYCDLCPRSFKHKISLEYHIGKDHLKLRNIECKICGKKFSAKQDLNSHMRQHRPKTECKLCGKKVQNMKQHMGFHVEVKCPICSKMVGESYLKEHMSYHAEAKCQICSKIVKAPYLREHIKNQHKEHKD